MKIASVRHKGLRRLIANDDASGVQASAAAKIRRIIFFLQDIESEEQLHSIPIWKAHQLTGSSRGRWSLHVTKNWRITFHVDERREIIDLDFEDYH